MGVVPCGKRTEFGYLKDFNNHYTIGKLLGHGQFGYTFAATVKANGDRVAVKRIDKNKVLWELGLGVFCKWGRLDGGKDGFAGEFLVTLFLSSSIEFVVLSEFCVFLFDGVDFDLSFGWIFGIML